MAGRRKPQEDVVIPTTALVASAVRYPGSVARIYSPSAAWQAECYRHYSICGEARFAANFFGHSLSRARLFTADISGGQVVEAAADSIASQTLDALFSGADGQAAMLTAIGVHLTVGGECFLVGRTATGNLSRDGNAEAGTDIWEIVSPVEMKVEGNAWSIKYGDGLPEVALKEQDVVIRIWRPHPSKRIEADSPFRSLLPILSEIEWLTLHIFAQTRSRLAGAGVLFLPQEMTFPPAPEVDGKPQQTANEAQAFMYTLAEAMLTPINNPSDPSALLPIAVTAPAEAIDKAKLMHFWSDLDAASLEMRTSSIHRFALGMDLPPEQILGMSNGGTGGGTSTGTSHWGQWQIDESTIKLHIEPMLDVVVNSLTVGYLRPGIADGNTNWAVRYDTSKLRLRPDRSKESMELYDRGALKMTVMLKENGFGPEDMPDPEETKEWFLRRVASGSATPEQVQAALLALGVPLDVVVSDPTQTPNEARPAPSLVDHPGRDLPQAAALYAACDALTYRALERAGNRLRQSVGKPPNCASYDVHTMVKANGTAKAMLEDAFACAPQILDGLGDHEQITPILEAYAHTLLAEQSPHSKDRLVKWLQAGLA